MKKIILFAALIVILASISSYSQSKFGLGIIVGEPTGISGKYFVNKDNAIDGAIAWSFNEYGSMHIHGDYLFHFYDVFTKEVPLYVGVGGRIKFKNTGEADGNDTKFGARIPVGIAYMPPKAPIDLFVEVVPMLDLTPSTEFTFNAAVGIRYWFK